MSDGMIKSWSPSRLFDYEECPRRAKYVSVDHLCPTCFRGKMKWENDVEACDRCGHSGDVSDALVKGNEVHKAAEEFIRLLREDIDPRLTAVSDWLHMFRAEYQERRVRVELMLAFDEVWRLTEWKSKRSRLRLKIDVLWIFEPNQVSITDWKTGKYRPNGEYSDPLNLYSVGALSAGFGHASSARLIFTDHGGDPVERPEGTVTIDTLQKEQRKWTKRATVMLSDQRFDPRPGAYCRWCPFSRNNGGPCQY